MDGYAKLSEYIQRLYHLSDEATGEFVGAFKEAKVKKRQFIVQPDFVARNRHFIVEGAFRAYVVGDKGSDHTISFAIEDWWITDYNSFIYQQPATMFVVALEDSTIMQINYEQEKALKQANHMYESIFRTMAERGLAFHQRRIIANLTLTAEERYEKLLEKYPQVFQRLPQYAIASYLGMTPEFLSKIRNRKVRKKG